MRMLAGSRCMSWISVVKSKPEEMREVLIFDDTIGMVVGYYYPSSNSFFGSVDGVRLTRATHWMPLPELPLMDE